MKFDSKKLIEFTGQISGCVIMGLVSAATQTLWYRAIEPKILKAMDENDKKHKHPIGFNWGGVLNRIPSLLFISADFANRIMERVLAQFGRATGEIPVGHRFKSDTASLIF